MRRPPSPLGDANQLKVNGAPVVLPRGSQYTLPGVMTVSRVAGTNGSVWTLTFTALDIVVRIDTESSYSNVMLDLPPRYRGRVNGLYGNFDGDAANDFLNVDGTVMVAPSVGAIYKAFTTVWAVPVQESLFDYDATHTWAYYNLQAFTPMVRRARHTHTHTHTYTHTHTHTRISCARSCICAPAAAASQWNARTHAHRGPRARVVAAGACLLDPRAARRGPRVLRDRRGPHRRDAHRVHVRRRGDGLRRRRRGLRCGQL